MSAEKDRVLVVLSAIVRVSEAEFPDNDSVNVLEKVLDFDLDAVGSRENEIEVLELFVSVPSSRVKVAEACFDLDLILLQDNVSLNDSVEENVGDGLDDLECVRVGLAVRSSVGVLEREPVTGPGVSESVRYDVIVAVVDPMLAESVLV
jgi:hypothetical protein